MRPDSWLLYRLMLRARIFEEAVRSLWLQGLISGEMHLGMGEEGIVAGVTAHLGEQDISAEVIDLRSVAPLDRRTVTEAAQRTGCLVVVDEDYREFGLSGEIAATVLESGINCRFRRVCTETTIPYSRTMENEVLPNVERITQAAVDLLHH